MTNANSFSETIRHGAEYNAEQWLYQPHILKQDFGLMREAGIDTITLGVFAWSNLEPEEGRYTFGWMDKIFGRAAEEGVKIILATPSGGKPNWLALRYPEVRRVGKNGLRDLPGARQNHCLTSPIYREKVQAMNSQLAQRYGRHPALVLWHISNEFDGYCYCDQCFGAFQSWLKNRYSSLDNLNHAYWAEFWSHTFTDWSQIQNIDETVHGLCLDWKRFMTAQCASFLRNEIAPIREFSSEIPITTNFHYTDCYNYFELSKDLDIVCWDSYPGWHSHTPEEDQTPAAVAAAFRHDLYRTMKRGMPFLMMETAPGPINWSPVSSPLLRPNVHRLNALQAIAHGANLVSYFQFRQSRGSSEKFHSGIISHAGRTDTRMFREISSLGTSLSKMTSMGNSRVHAETALIFDWENFWAISQSQSPQNTHKEYRETCIAHYRPFWERGIPVDVVDCEANLDSYRLLIVPMLHLLRGGISERIEAFVARGGTIIGTYQTGYVNESDLCFLGGFPGPLRQVFGVWVEEFDALDESRRRYLSPSQVGYGLSGVYECRHYVDLVNAEGASVLGTYNDDFYAGRPALTLNHYGKGHAYYVASRNDTRFQNDFLGFVAADLSLRRALEGTIPMGVTAHIRKTANAEYLFLLNFRSERALVKIPSLKYRDMETGILTEDEVNLESFGSKVLEKMDAQSDSCDPSPVHSL